MNLLHLATIALVIILVLFVLGILFVLIGQPILMKIQMRNMKKVEKDFNSFFDDFGKSKDDK